MSCFLDLQSFFFPFPPPPSLDSLHLLHIFLEMWCPKLDVTEVMSLLSRGERIASPIPPKMFVLYINLWSSHLNILLMHIWFLTHYWSRLVSAKLLASTFFFSLYRWESLLNWLYITFIFILKDRKKKKSALGVHLPTFVKTILSFLLIV